MPFFNATRLCEARGERKGSKHSWLFCKQGVNAHCCSFWLLWSVIYLFLGQRLNRSCTFPGPSLSLSPPFYIYGISDKERPLTWTLVSLSLSLCTIFLYSNIRVILRDLSKKEKKKKKRRFVILPQERKKENGETTMLWQGWSEERSLDSRRRHPPGLLHSGTWTWELEICSY